MRQKILILSDNFSQTACQITLVVKIQWLKMVNGLKAYDYRQKNMPQLGIEPRTQGFSVPCSTNWAIAAYLFNFHRIGRINSTLPTFTVSFKPVRLLYFLNIFNQVFFIYFIYKKGRVHLFSSFHYIKFNLVELTKQLHFCLLPLVSFLLLPDHFPNLQ